MVLNVAHSIFLPDDWVLVVRFRKELHDVVSPCCDRMEPFLAVDDWQVPFDRIDGSGGEVVPKDAEC